MNNQNLSEITKCEVCGNCEIVEALNLGNHPMCDDLVETKDSRICKEYPIVIMYCKKCDTAHQKFQIPKAELFPKTYHYRSRFTNDVLNGMKNLVEACEKHFGSLEGKKVLDIGCNDGSLLDFFKERGAATFGIEPTDAFADALEKGHTALNEFFSVESAKKIAQSYGKPDIITFTNVFAHIEDLNGVLQALKVLAGDSTLIIIENHYLGAVIDKNQFDTFYHEHPRTYSYSSFVYIAESLGMSLINVEFPSRYGGNIRVTIGNEKIYPPVDFKAGEVLVRESKFYDRLIEMNDFIARWKAEKNAEIEDLSNKYGKLPGKAFPGRAAILIKLLGLDVDTVSEIYEKPGSMKIGHYVPGTRIPIKSDDELMEKIEDVPVLINFAWHIKDEIENYLRSKGFKGTVVNIL